MMTLVLISACTPEQNRIAELVNSSRAEAELPHLTSSLPLMDKAQRWAEQLAAAGALSHSDLAEGMPEGYRSLGENVAAASTIEAAHQALLNSPEHLENIMNPAFNWIGTGYAAAPDGTVYVVQVFAQY